MLFSLKLSIKTDITFITDITSLTFETNVLNIISREYTSLANICPRVMYYTVLLLITGVQLKDNIFTLYQVYKSRYVDPLSFLLGDRQIIRKVI